MRGAGALVSAAANRRPTQPDVCGDLRMGAAVVETVTCRAETAGVREYRYPLLLFQAGHDQWVLNEAQNRFIHWVRNAGGTRNSCASPARCMKSSACRTKSLGLILSGFSRSMRMRTSWITDVAHCCGTRLLCGTVVAQRTDTDQSSLRPTLVCPSCDSPITHRANTNRVNPKPNRIRLPCDAAVAPRYQPAAHSPSSPSRIDLNGVSGRNPS